MPTNFLQKNIELIRRKWGLSQSAFGQLFNKKTRGAVQGWETGISKPSVDILIQMSDLTGLSLDQLVLREISEDQIRILPDEMIKNKENVKAKISYENIPPEVAEVLKDFAKQVDNLTKEIQRIKKTPE